MNPTPFFEALARTSEEVAPRNQGWPDSGTRARRRSCEAYLALIVRHHGGTMSYLYGDSSASPLKSNFLAFLEDALDFCVSVLLADEQIEFCRTDMADAERESAAEFSHLSAQNAAVKL